MHQIAFMIGGKAIHWYGVCIAAGFLAATGLMLLMRRCARLTKDQVFDIAMISICAGIFGARLFFVIQFWDEFFAGRSFLEVFRIDKGGLVFYGGFLCAFAALCIYAARKKLSIRLILDLAAPAIAAAHACGRIGCFLQGCCFGKTAPASWPGAVRYPLKSLPGERYPDFTAGTSLPVFPVQLYEAGLNFLLCGVLLFLLAKNRKPGRIAALYLICYAVMRFSLEFFRGDHTDFFLGMTPSQNIALFLMLPLGALVWFVFPRAPLPPGGESAEKRK